MPEMDHQNDFSSVSVQQLREDLALALRAAAHHGLAKGVCNHFSVELPDSSRRFLLNPRGLLWREIQADDIVMIDEQGNKPKVPLSAPWLEYMNFKLCDRHCKFYN